MTLGTILRKYLRPGKTGQLVIQFAEEGHRLCKIYVENGKATYLTLGNQSPEQVLETLAGKTPKAVNFIEGLRPPQRLGEPLNEKLLQAVDSGGPSPVPEEVWVDEPVPAQKVEALVEDFIDIIGPLGSVIAERALSSIGYRKGIRISGENYSLLLSTFLREIPEAQREGFKRRNL